MTDESHACLSVVIPSSYVLGAAFLGHLRDGDRGLLLGRVLQVLGPQGDSCKPGQHIRWRSDRSHIDETFAVVETISDDCVEPFGISFLFTWGQGMTITCLALLYYERK